jgi:hypothetical protein
LALGWLLFGEPVGWRELGATAVNGGRARHGTASYCRGTVLSRPLLMAFRPLQLAAAQAIGGRPGLLVLAAPLRALALATLPAATQPATQADVAEDDANRGTVGCPAEFAAPLSRLAVRRHDPRWESSALAAHAGICAGGGEQSPSLPRRVSFQRLSITHHLMN